MSTPTTDALTVTINYWSDEPVTLVLEDVESIEATAANSTGVESFETNCDDLVRVLEALAPFAENFNWGDEFEIDGVQMDIAEHANGGSWFVPNEHANGVAVLASFMARWESGGPCIFDESEQLLRYDDLYWVETTGDMFQQRVVVGRFTDEKEALNALAHASEYCSYEPQRGIVCELDQWGDIEL